VNQPVDLRFDGPLAIISLNSPPLNIFDVAMRDELIGALTAANDVPAVRVVVLRSEGKHFSAGADLSEFGTASSIFEGRRIRWDRDPWVMLHELRIPTVVALRGTTLGSGFEMSMLCDIRLAAQGTRVGLPETKLGMLPAAGGTQSLLKAIGAPQALPIIALGEPIPAEEARALSLVHEVCDDVDARAYEVARQLAAIEPPVLAATRRLLRVAADEPIELGLATENRVGR